MYLSLLIDSTQLLLFLFVFIVYRRTDSIRLFIYLFDGMSVSNKDTHLKDILEACEPDECKRSYLNTIGSKNLRLLFYGMLRKQPTSPLDTFLIF